MAAPASKGGGGGSTARNPFFVTSSTACGLNVGALQKQQRQWQRQRQTEEEHDQPSTARSQPPVPHFPFLYRRTSDEIGKGIAGTTTRMASTSSLSPPCRGHVPAPSSATTTTTAAPPPPSTAGAGGLAPAFPGGVGVVDPAAYLQGYKHHPKAEHPLYTTSQNAIGARAPNLATVVTNRRLIPQEFTNSFNNVKYSDQSLNCTLTRSKVHKALDLQFF